MAEDWYLLILRAIAQGPAAYFGSLRVRDLDVFLSGYALGRRSVEIRGADPERLRFPLDARSVAPETELMQRFGLWLEARPGESRYWAELVEERSALAGRASESALVALELLREFLREREGVVL